MLHNFFCVFKVQPIKVEVIDQHNTFQTNATESRTKIDHLEQAEGLQSVELNKERITICNELISWQIKIRKLINETTVAASGDRKCITGLETLKVLNLKDAIRKYKEADPSLPWTSVENCTETLWAQAKLIVAEDDRFFKSSLFEATADVFESIEFYLKKIYDQMYLLNRRLVKLNTVKQEEENMQKLQLNSVATSLRKEIFSAYQRDVESAKELAKELDSAEALTQNFIEDVFQDKAIDSTFSKKEMQEATKLFQFIINIRNLQQEIEDTIPELKELKDKELENIQVEETVNEDE